MLGNQHCQKLAGPGSSRNIILPRNVVHIGLAVGPVVDDLLGSLT